MDVNIAGTAVQALRTGRDTAYRWAGVATREATRAVLETTYPGMLSQRGRTNLRNMPREVGIRSLLGFAQVPSTRDLNSLTY